VRGSGVLDLGLLVSERPCDAAAVFTRNAFKGAPLGVTREAVEAGGLRAVVVNSGNANAATGARGVEDAYAMQGAAGEAIGGRGRAGGGGFYRCDRGAPPDG
jgi:glutamate N-acetyltransferase / amino-acid N-acetyltransferase